MDGRIHAFAGSLEDFKQMFPWYSLEPSSIKPEEIAVEIIKEVDEIAERGCRVFERGGESALEEYRRSELASVGYLTEEHPAGRSLMIGLSITTYMNRRNLSHLEQEVVREIKNALAKNGNLLINENCKVEDYVDIGLVKGMVFHHEAYQTPDGVYSVDSLGLNFLKKKIG